MTDETVKSAWVTYAVKQMRVALAYDKVVNRCLDRVDLLTECASMPFDLSARALWYVVGNGVADA